LVARFRRLTGANDFIELRPKLYQAQPVHAEKIGEAVENFVRDRCANDQWRDIGKTKLHPTFGGDCQLILFRKFQNIGLKHRLRSSQQKAKCNRWRTNHRD